MRKMCFIDGLDSGGTFNFSFSIAFFFFFSDKSGYVGFMDYNPGPDYSHSACAPPSRRHKTLEGVEPWSPDARTWRGSPSTNRANPGGRLGTSLVTWVINLWLHSNVHRLQSFEAIAYSCSPQFVEQCLVIPSKVNLIIQAEVLGLYFVM